MRKHLYFYSSNLEYARDLKDESCFEYLYQYPKNEIEKAHENEYGRIKTKDTYFHFLIGTIRNNDCPWCGCSEICLKKEEDKSYGTMNPFSKDKYFMQCTHCGSRGPVVFGEPSITNDKDFNEYLISLIKENYSRRLSWDSKLNKGMEND